MLLLDFGGVCLLNPVEMHHIVEDRLGLPAGTFEWMGPIRPDTDEPWREMIAGRGLTERGYWHKRAADVGHAAGRKMDLAEYMRILFHPPTPAMVRPEAVDVVDRTREAGLGVSILTNDMQAFHGAEWQLGIDLLKSVDHIVDCSYEEFLKPDPRAYRLAVETTGVAADRLLFVDDQPRNAAGARDFGMDAVDFDVAHPAESWHDVARRLGL